MINIKGIICAMVTPMHDDEQINYEVLRKLTEHVITEGVHGVFALGTTGEMFSLDMQEKQSIVKTVIDQTKGRVPVFAGCGAVSTRETMETAKKMEALGADALSIVTPHFITPSQEEMYHHYKKIAESTSLPIILYNIPARTGCSLKPETVVRLSEIPNIVGIKDSSGDFDNLKAYRDLTDKGFAVLAGTDSQILSGLKIGANGAIAATSNVVPRLVAGIYNHFMAGDMETAEQLQAQLQPLRDNFKLGTVPSILKESVNIIGIEAGPARGPLLRPSEEVLIQLTESVLSHYGDYALK